MNPLAHASGSYWPSSETTPPYTIKQEQASVIYLDDDSEDVYKLAATRTHSRHKRTTSSTSASAHDFSIPSMSHPTTFYPMARPSICAATSSSSHTSPHSPSGSAVDNALQGIAAAGTPGRQRVSAATALAYAAAPPHHRSQHTPETTPPPISINVQHLMQRSMRSQPNLAHLHQDARRHSAMATTGYSMFIPSQQQPTAAAAAATVPSLTRAPTPVPEPVMVDVRKTSTSSLADYAAQMICHLWFSPEPLTSLNSKRKSKPLWNSPPSPSSPSSSDDVTSNSFLSPLQEPTQAFRVFVHDAIKTTLVSHSVVIVALLYIYKLKCRNPFLMGGSGSEYRLAATSLMLANKFLDDNTYTLKTWATVTRMPLHEMLSMEVELIKCLDHDLTVRPKEYDAWLEMLHGFMRARAVVYGRGALPGALSPGLSVAAAAAVEPRGRYRFHPGSTATTKPRGSSSSAAVSSRARSNSPLRGARALAAGAAWRSRLAAETGMSKTTPEERPTKRQARHQRPLSNDLTRQFLVSPTSSLSHVATPPAGSASAEVGDVIAPRSATLQASDAPVFSSGPAAPTTTGHDHLAAPFTYRQSNRTLDPDDLVYYALAASPVDARRLSAEQAAMAAATAGGSSSAAPYMQPQSQVFVDEYGRRHSVMMAGNHASTAQLATYPSPYANAQSDVHSSATTTANLAAGQSLQTSPRGTVVLDDDHWSAFAPPATYPAQPLYVQPQQQPIASQQLYNPINNSSNSSAASSSLAHRHVHVHRGHFANAGAPGYAYFPPELAPSRGNDGWVTMVGAGPGGLGLGVSGGWSSSSGGGGHHHLHSFSYAHGGVGLGLGGTSHYFGQGGLMQAPSQQQDRYSIASLGAGAGSLSLLPGHGLQHRASIAGGAGSMHQMPTSMMVPSPSYVHPLPMTTTTAAAAAAATSPSNYDGIGHPSAEGFTFDPTWTMQPTSTTTTN